MIILSEKKIAKIYSAVTTTTEHRWFSPISDFLSLLALSSMACIEMRMPLLTMPHFKTSYTYLYVIIVSDLYDRYRKYQRHGLLGSLLLVNGKPVRSQWVNESTGAHKQAGAQDPHALGLIVRESVLSSIQNTPAYVGCPEITRSLSNPSFYSQCQDDF